MSEELQKTDDTALQRRQGNFVLGTLGGTATAVVFGVGGFFLIQDEYGAMGGVLFLLLPFVTGFATALLSRGRNLIAASLVIGALICTAFLLATGKEGWVCLLMSTPLIVIGLTIGALFGVIVRRKLIDETPKPHVTALFLLLVVPFFLMGANRAEEKSRRTPRAETITNKLIVDAPPEVVWNQLKSVDKISGSKGLLMRIGLPVPVSCAMEGEGVGAKRTCYFESGHIEERVTEWDPPRSMKFAITEFDVPGRPWLSFQDAEYQLTQDNGHTVITRRTTIVSRLSPAWYWRRLEQIGVETEHEYLFQELKRRMDGAK
jgi:hypothetical protein